MGVSRAPRRVFVSHTSELRDLPAERSFIAAIESAIKRAGDVVVDMAYFTAHDRSPAQLDRATVFSADVYVLLAGFRYGSPVRDRPEVSYTEHEFECAGEAHLPRLVFLLSEKAEGPAALFRDPEFAERQERFRRRLQDSGVTTTEVMSPDHAETVVLHALTRLQDAEPTATHRVWSVPARPQRVVGREDQLVALHSALFVRRPTAVQVVHGMGGIGKTTLVLEYVHRHVRDYDIAWWIHAEQPELIPNQLAALARALRLVDPTDMADVAIARLSGALSAESRWLLVFDNAVDPTTLAPLLPGGGGHVVITSRNPQWDRIAERTELREFVRADSVALVLARVPALTEADANRVAEATGDLPLAVDQAAALLADTGWDVSTYLDLLHRNAERLLAHRDGPDGYPMSVGASWQITFDRLASADPAAWQLITVAAWLAPEPVPLKLFTEHAPSLPEPLATAASDPLAWVRILASLRRHAVARIDAGSLVLHRIPATLLRDQTPSHKDSWPVTAVTLLRMAAPEDPWNQPATWPAWRALLGHVLTATDADRPLGAVADEVDWLLDRVGSYLQTTGDPASARPHFERAYRQRNERLGADHPDTLVSANNLVSALWMTGEAGRALQLAEDTLDRKRRVLGDDDPSTLTSANNFATYLWHLGHYEQARAIDQDTLARRRRVLGEDHPHTLLSASNLAADFRELGNAREALELDADTLDHKRRVLGDDHLLTLLSAHNLATDLWAAGEYRQARDLDEDTFGRYRRILGPDHPRTLLSANNFITDLRAVGDHERARDLEQDTFDRCRRVLGDDHPDTLAAASNLTANRGASEDDDQPRDRIGRPRTRHG